MFAREPKWVSWLRNSKWRHKYAVLFALSWAAIILALWILNDWLIQ